LHLLEFISETHSGSRINRLESGLVFPAGNLPAVYSAGVVALAGGFLYGIEKSPENETRQNSYQKYDPDGFFCSFAPHDINLRRGIVPGYLSGDEMDERSRAPAEDRYIGRDMYVFANFRIEIGFGVIPDVLSAGEGGEVGYFAKKEDIEIIKATGYEREREDIAYNYRHIVILLSNYTLFKPERQ
jgi:hypothetical protein